MAEISNARTTDVGEQERLAALRRYAVLDTAAEAAYDDVTRLAAQLCDTPMALVSLVDASRQWFKSRVGMDASETPRDIAFCNWAIRDDQLFEVADASQDARFRDNPLVTGDPGIRFYAGAPLCTPDGKRIGTLCVLDRAPRELTAQQRAALQVLARQVVLQLEMRLNIDELSRARSALLQDADRLASAEASRGLAERFMRGTLDALSDNIAIVDRHGVIVHVNQAWQDFAHANAGSRPLAACLPGANYLAVCDRASELGAVEAGDVARAIREGLASDTARELRCEYPCHAPHEHRWFEASVTVFGEGEGRFAVVSHRDVSARRRADDALSSANAALESRVLARTRDLEAANAALRSSEERFRSVFENTSVGAVIIERDGRMVQANQAFAAITGREVGTLVDAGYKDVVHPDDLPGLLALRAQLLDGRMRGYVHEVRFVRPGGEEIWAHISVGAIRNSAGLVSQTVALVQDISQHRRAAYERDQFFELSVDMFVIVDLDGMIHRTNPACQRILGYDQQELDRMPYLDLVHPDDRERMRLELARLVADATAELVDVRVRDKSGAYRDVRWSAAMWKQGNLVLAVGRDITSKRAAERALYERDAMLERAENMALMGSCYLDANDGSVSCSKGFLALAGLPEPAPSRTLEHVLQVFQAQDRPALQQAIERVLAAGEPTGLRCRCVRVDGDVRELQMFVEPRHNPAGQVAGVSGACLDVTAFERATRQAQQSEQRMRALAERLQGIREEERTRISREIHDELGQMLTALKIDITLLVRDLGGSGPAPERSGLLEDLRSVGRMVDGTLQSVRRIAHQMRPEMLDALGLVPAIESQASDMQARTGLRVAVEAPDEMSDIDPHHSTELFRIVQEAMTNVLRHADATQVVIGLSRTREVVQLSVRDDGKGFDSEAGAAGPSLGILGMRERAVANGGEFRIDSRPGAGTRIDVRMPVVAQPALADGSAS